MLAGDKGRRLQVGVLCICQPSPEQFLSPPLLTRCSFPGRSQPVATCYHIVGASTSHTNLCLLNFAISQTHTWTVHSSYPTTGPPCSPSFCCVFVGSYFCIFEFFFLFIFFGLVLWIFDCWYYRIIPYGSPTHLI